MPEEIQDSNQIKRIPIQKCRVCDITASAPADGNGNFFESPIFGRLARVHVFGTVIDTFVSADKNYAFFTVDDTTGVIRCKAFGNTTDAADIKTGQAIDVIGRIREYNSERYIMPEIVRPSIDPNLETLRWLELAKILKDAGAMAQSTPEPKKEEAKTDIPKDARAKIVEIINKENNGEGVEQPAIVSLSGLPPDVVDSILAELLSEGTCYEPRPGKIRLL